MNTLSRSRMTMRAHVERDTAALVKNPWNTDVVPVWTALDDTIPCYVWMRTGKKVADDRKVAVLKDLRMMTPHSADLKESDKVTKITDRKGATLFPGPFTIDASQRMDTHVEWLLGEGRPV